MAGAERWVGVAEVARPHGIRGELRLRVFNEHSKLLLKKPPIRLRFEDGTEKDATIAAARSVNKAILVELTGLGDRNGSELLRGATILVQRDRFPELAEGEFYACDVEGAKAMLEGDEIGRVLTLTSYPTCDVLVVERADKTKLEVPLTEAYVKRVDPEAQVVELVTVEGL